ncbi:MAG: TIR domain-containing protein [Lachnospiraceae bacterium]|nr:TIR domain-containing protein [Lachnospiraceae bacterium]
MENKVFISHSSKNSDIAGQLNSFFMNMGVSEDDIFCSSIGGQGVKNGDELGATISEAIRKSKTLVFLITREFLKSTYCMQELGVGWYLSKQCGIKCFCLVFPDVKLSDVAGFFNTAIFKVTIVKQTQMEEFSCFAEELCKELGVSMRSHSAQSKIENNFFAGINSMIDKLIAAAQKEEQDRPENQLARLREEINEKNNKIVSLESEKTNIEAGIEKEIKEEKLRCLVRVTASASGYTREEYKNNYLLFNNMIEEYEGLIEALGDDYKNNHMELSIATILLHRGEVEDAYRRFLYYLKHENSVFISFLKNFCEAYEGSFQEAIEILKEKLKGSPMRFTEADDIQDCITYLEGKEARTLLSAWAKIPVTGATI